MYWELFNKQLQITKVFKSLLLSLKTNHHVEHCLVICYVHVNVSQILDMYIYWWYVIVLIVDRNISRLGYDIPLHYWWIWINAHVTRCTHLNGYFWTLRGLGNNEITQLKLCWRLVLVTMPKVVLVHRSGIIKHIISMYPLSNILMLPVTSLASQVTSCMACNGRRF